jgi:hypothetical protein
MKSLIIALVVFPLSVNAMGRGSGSAFTATPAASAQPRVFPQMTWAIKPMIRAGTVISVEDMRRIYQTTKDSANQVTDPNVVTEMITNIGQQITRLSELNEEEVALEIVNAIFTLSEMGESLKKTSVNAGAAASFVVFPTPVSALNQILALDDFKSFSGNLLAGMTVAQEIHRAQGLSDKPWYFLGAVGNVKVSTREQNEMHLQLVLGLRPQVVDQGANKVEIPAVLKAEDAPVAIIDVTMPLDITLPKIELTFGKLGELQPTKNERLKSGRQTVTKTEWRFRFETGDTNFCARANSTPRVLQKMAGVTLQIPIYSAVVDGNEQRMTSADVRLAGPSFAPLMCWGVFGVVPSQFMQEVNKTLTDNTFSDLLRMSLRELAERVQRLKQQADTLP